MALTACVAAQPLLANAAETGSEPEASADLNLQNQNAAPEDSTGGAPDAAANAKALPPEAPANTEADADGQAPAFGPETDTDDVKIDYTESTTTGATTTETGDAFIPAEGTILSIDQIIISNNADNKVYSISGVRMNGVKNLPAGLYIINGKKYLVK